VFPLILAFALTPLLVIYHPYFYGDALWYAMDLRDGKGLIPEPGHLGWRPAALGVWYLIERCLGRAVDPLIAFQILSSLGATIACAGVYLLGRALNISVISSTSAASLTLLSHMLLAYGGSGSSYTAAMGCIVLGVLIVVKSLKKDVSISSVIGASFFIALAWMWWGMTFLIMPSFALMIFLLAKGSATRRCLLTLLSGISVGGILIPLTYFAYKLSFSSSPYVAWLQSSSHDIPLTVSLLGVARAAYGFIQQFLHLGDAGTTFKALLLRDFAHVAPTALIFPVVKGSLFVLLVLGGVYGSVISERTRHSRLILITVLLLFPVGLFASLWQGSDVERFCLSLPFVALFLCYGLDASLSRSRLSLPWSLVGVSIIGGANLLSLVTPAVAEKGGFPMHFGVAARIVLPEHSLVVVTGQRFGPVVEAPSSYFYNVELFNIQRDCVEFGINGWQDRLRERIRRAFERNGELAALKGLRDGNWTEESFQVIGNEYPHPSHEEISRFFGSLPFREEFSIGEYEVDRFFTQKGVGSLGVQ
jgi:hypothetical protein